MLWNIDIVLRKIYLGKYVVYFHYLIKYNLTRGPEGPVALN